MPVVRVKSPLKVTAVDAAPSVIVIVPAATVPLKVVPPELVMVRVPTPEVDVPAIVAPETAPAVLMVSCAVPLLGPVTVVKVIGVAAVAPTVRLLFRAIAPVVI